MYSARHFASRLLDLLRQERAFLAEFLVALAEFDRKQLWARLGYDGLFSFLHRELRLSKAAAFQRQVAARLLQRFPSIEAGLREGRLCMTAIAHLAKVLTPENQDDILPRFYGLSSREAEAMAAALAPRSVATQRQVVTTVRPSVARGSSIRAPGSTVAGSEGSASAATPGTAVAAPGVPAPSLTSGQVPLGDSERSAPSPPLLALAPDRRPEAKPLTAELHRLHVTVSRRFLDKLAEATEALSHARPGARAEEILEAGLDLLLQRAARRKGLIDHPQRKERPCAPDRAPARVRREVWKRDGGRCQWPLASGGVCGSRVKLELDHIVPRALGGPSTTGNLRVVCRFHNQLAARQVFGNPCIDRFSREARPDMGDGCAAPLLIEHHPRASTSRAEDGGRGPGP